MTARNTGDQGLLQTSRGGPPVNPHLREAFRSSPALRLHQDFQLLAGEALPDPRWDASLLLCKLRDLFSPH